MRFRSAQGLTDQPLNLSVSDDKIKLYKFLKRRALEMTNNPTFAEKRLSNMLDNMCVKYEFQKVIPPYIADFVIMSKKLIIEVDGNHHDEDTNQLSHDTKRDSFLSSLGFIVIRFTNDEVLKNPTPVMNQIIEYSPKYETKRFYNNVQEHEYGFLNNRTSRRVFYHYFRKALKRELRKILNWRYKGDMLPKIGIGIILLLLLNCSSIWAQELTASYYSTDSLKKEGTYAYSGGKMANGKLFRDAAATCACNSYKLGAVLRVTNLSNGRSVVVINSDHTAKRFKGKRIDLSISAMRALDGISRGLIQVEVTKL
jgi:very-short-patch-repair endonuclease